MVDDASSCKECDKRRGSCHDDEDDDCLGVRHVEEHDSNDAGVTIFVFLASVVGSFTEEDGVAAEVIDDNVFSSGKHMMDRSESAL